MFCNALIQDKEHKLFCKHTKQDSSTENTPPCWSQNWAIYDLLNVTDFKIKYSPIPTGKCNMDSS